MYTVGVTLIREHVTYQAHSTAEGLSLESELERGLFAHAKSFASTREVSERPIDALNAIRAFLHPCDIIMSLDLRFALNRLIFIK